MGFSRIQSSLLVSDLSQHPSLWRSPSKVDFNNGYHTRNWNNTFIVPFIGSFSFFWVAKNAALTMKHFLTSMIPLSYLIDGELFLINSDEVWLKGWVQREKDMQPKPSSCCKGGPELLSVSDKMVLRSCA